MHNQCTPGSTVLSNVIKKKIITLYNKWCHCLFFFNLISIYFPLLTLILWIYILMYLIYYEYAETLVQWLFILITGRQEAIDDLRGFVLIIQTFGYTYSSQAPGLFVQYFVLTLSKAYRNFELKHKFHWKKNRFNV